MPLLKLEYVLFYLLLYFLGEMQQGQDLETLAKQSQITSAIQTVVNYKTLEVFNFVSHFYSL